MKGQLLLNIDIAKSSLKNIESTLECKRMLESTYKNSAKRWLCGVFISSLFVNVFVKGLPSVDKGDGNTFTKTDLFLVYILLLLLIFVISKIKKKRKFKDINKQLREEEKLAEQYIDFIQDDSLNRIPACFRNYKALDGIGHYISIGRASNLKEAMELYDKERYDSDRRDNGTGKYNMAEKTDTAGCGCLAALAGLTIFEWMYRLISRM